MKHNERGFLQGTIEAIPILALVRQKGKYPFPRATGDADAENKLSEHFRHRPIFQVRTFKLDRRSPRLPGRVSCSGLRSIQPLGDR
jgi:hypothetical protein